jgi:CYTH domain-containing protein
MLEDGDPGKGALGVGAAMDIDHETAAALGWPKLKYAWVERERRWLCAAVPSNLVVRSEAITDLYVTGTRLRLREAVPVGGGAPQRRLGRKADVDAHTRLLTSIYLSSEEFTLLSSLPGRTLRKTRHHIGLINGVEMSVDEFEGGLAGLIMAEAEFEDAATMAAYPSPDFALREVTEDARFSGGRLVTEGLPE